VLGLQSFSATIHSPQLLSDFPFDTQSLSLQLEPGGAEVMDFSLFLTEDTLSTMSPTSPDGWELLKVSARSGDKNYTNLGTTVSHAQFFFHVRRVPDFVVNRFVVPLCLIMVITISSSLFAAGFAGRIAAPMAGVASTVTFLFVSSASTPQLPYATRLDRFFLLCFFTCFSLFHYHAVSYLAFERFKKAFEEARKRNAGRLHILWASALPPESEDMVSGENPHPHARINTEAAKRSASKVARSLIGVALETPSEYSDVISFFVFLMAFMIGERRLAWNGKSVRARVCVYAAFGVAYARSGYGKKRMPPLTHPHPGTSVILKAG